MTFLCLSWKKYSFPMNIMNFTSHNHELQYCPNCNKTFPPYHAAPVYIFLHLFIHFPTCLILWESGGDAGVYPSYHWLKAGYTLDVSPFKACIENVIIVCKTLINLMLFIIYLFILPLFTQAIKNRFLFPNAAWSHDKSWVYRVN